MKVVIVGGGVVGLAIAWRALGRGLDVVVVDPTPGRHASWIGAGMLPAANEMILEQPDLLKLCLASRAAYPSFVAELESVAGVSSGYRNDGLLDVAHGPADLPSMARLEQFAARENLRVQTLSGVECRQFEPELAEGVQGGVFWPEDGSVDPRRLTAALLAAVERLGGTLVRERVRAVVLAGERATGVQLAAGTVVSGDQVLLAAGCGTHQLEGLPPGSLPQVRPVKGQVLRLRSARPFLNRTVRGLVDGAAVYIVSRTDGELVVGATYEDTGDDTTVTAGGLKQLLDRSGALLPGIGALEIAEFSAGLRPTTRDDLPVLGRTGIPGLLVATGHARIGIQLTPVTGDIMADVLTTGDLPDLARSFTVDRFVSAAVG